MTTLTAAADAQREALLRAETESAIQLSRAYSLAFRQIQRTLTQLAEALSAEGAKADADWLYAQDLYRRLNAGIVATFTEYGSGVAQTIFAQQSAALAAAERDALSLLTTAGARGPHPIAPPTVADLEASLTARVNSLQLGLVVPTFAFEQARATLLKHLGTLTVPRLIAHVRTALGSVLGRCLGTHRTETIHAYRTAVQAVYTTNTSMMRGYQWYAHLDKPPRPCPLCVALHGRVYDIDAPFGTHANCRCLALPVLHAVSTPPIALAGTDWFANQPTTVQHEVLGPKRYALYHSGQATLDDMVGEKSHPVYGTVRFVRSLQSLRARSA